MAGSGTLRLYGNTSAGPSAGQARSDTAAEWGAAVG